MELQTGRLVFLDAEHFSDLSELLEAVKKIPIPLWFLKIIITFHNAFKHDLNQLYFSTVDF